MISTASPWSFAKKRMLDLFLLLPLLPFFGVLVAVLALLVLACDGRPVLFVQERAGRHRRTFGILKLRTMTNETDVRLRRPTWLGSRLRQHGLDELPQLWNVFRGEMSLVGPRPLLPADADRLTGLDARFAARFLVLPGLTGLAQVTLARGAAITAALDGRYAATRSVFLDLRILFRTAWMNLVGKQRGALRLEGP